MSHLRFIEREVDYAVEGLVTTTRVARVLQEMRDTGSEWMWVDIPIYTLEEQAEDAKLEVDDA